MRKLWIWIIGAMPLWVASLALAEDGGGGNVFQTKGMLALAAGLGIGIAAFGGALAQGRTNAAALEGIARNPNAQNKIFTPMILGLAFIESLVIFTWVIEFFLYNTIGKL